MLIFSSTFSWDFCLCLWRHDKPSQQIHDVISIKHKQKSKEKVEENVNITIMYFIQAVVTRLQKQFIWLVCLLVCYVIHCFIFFSQNFWSIYYVFKNILKISKIKICPITLNPIYCRLENKAEQHFHDSIAA